MRLPASWAAIDVETADTFGAGPDGRRVLPSHICSLACVVVVDGRVVEAWAQLVKPVVSIDPKTTAIHGITDSDVADAQPFGAMHERLRQTFSRHRVAALVAHNAPFDHAVLDAECERNGLAKTSRPWIDSIDLARASCPWLAKPQGPGYGLAALCGELGIYHQHHDALSDAEACALVALSLDYARDAVLDPIALARAYCAGVRAVRL